VLVFWQFVLRKYSVYWTFGFTKGAIDTLIRMDDQKIWTLIEAINWTHFHAISELALYTGVADHKVIL